MDRYLEPRIAAELRAELARQGHSRHWLAEQTDLPVTTVARWLRGPQSPGLNALDAICQALGMTIPDLFAAVERNGGYEPVTSLPRRAEEGAGATSSREVSSRSNRGYVIPEQGYTFENNIAQDSEDPYRAAQKPAADLLPAAA